jgi:hypothetical protein
MRAEVEIEKAKMCWSVPNLTCKFSKICDFYAFSSVVCKRGSNDYCGAYKNLAYGRVIEIVEKEKGINKKAIED